jgi:hypothetical protein
MNGLASIVRRRGRGQQVDPAEAQCVLAFVQPVLCLANPWDLRLERTEDQELGPKLAPQVDEPYQTLLAAMLKRDPAQRPAMNEVRDCLSSARGPSASRVNAFRTPRGDRRRQPAAGTIPVKLLTALEFTL